MDDPRATDRQNGNGVGLASQRIRGTGEMADRIRHHAWDQTPFGPIVGWPSELVVAVNLMLSSKLITCLIWGPERILLYNDLYRPLLGTKPASLGEPFLEVWREIRDQASAIISEPMKTGEANLFERVEFRIVLDGQLVERICTLSNNPIWVETTDGPKILGLFSRFSISPKRNGRNGSCEKVKRSSPLSTTAAPSPQP
ncbi:hypothetical protein HDF16_006033 [Granulicella aggregans]|uniref:PAS domain-containing protein n=2 Tax=Granulicella aggregans TaxID=474949 RepID=A0A7W7ZJW9_9BACT|nr:hypothetical protein [Granulicella aggregans]